MQTKEANEESHWDMRTQIGYPIGLLNALSDHKNPKDPPFISLYSKLILLNNQGWEPL
jgi:hypothetical protein